jgi:hypothetical protein
VLKRRAQRLQAIWVCNEALCAARLDLWAPLLAARDHAHRVTVVQQLIRQSQAPAASAHDQDARHSERMLCGVASVRIVRVRVREGPVEVGRRGRIDRGVPFEVTGTKGHTQGRARGAAGEVG